MSAVIQASTEIDLEDAAVARKKPEDSADRELVASARAVKGPPMNGGRYPRSTQVNSVGDHPFGRRAVHGGGRCVVHGGGRCVVHGGGRRAVHGGGRRRYVPAVTGCRAGVTPRAEAPPADRTGRGG
jgi:hypothetical protein